MRRLYLTIVAAMLALNASGIPAWRGTIVLHQPDGKRIQARLTGDEFAHVMTDMSGYPLIQGEDGYWRYASYSPNGTAAPTTKIAGIDSPPAIVSIPYERLSEDARLRRMALYESQSVSEHKADETVRKACLIIPVNYSDVKLTTPEGFFERLVNGGQYSISRYFSDQFPDNWEFTFTVVNPVTLPHKQAYYGTNKGGHDSFAYKAIIDACKATDEAGTDFSHFDADGDGNVDNIYLFLAGKDESDGGGDDCIWAHYDRLSLHKEELDIDGKKIDSYAMSAELSLHSDGTFNPTGIGAFCHEYSHSLGLMDMYDTDLSASGGRTEMLWEETSLMYYGSRNNDGRTPPYYDAVDRDYLGIGTMEELAPGQYRLEPIGEGGRYFRYNGPKEGEYYLISCRLDNDWDMFIGGRGLAIYHIDRSDNPAGYSASLARNVTASQRWAANEVNCNPQHPCAYMEEAYAGAEDVSQIFFPYGEITSFTPNTDPAFIFWDGSTSKLAIRDIAFVGNSIAFNVVEVGSNLPPKANITSVDVFQDSAILQWSAEADTTSAIFKYKEDGKTYTQKKVRPYLPGKYAISLEGLKPDTRYFVRISYGKEGEEVCKDFVTKRIYSGGYPFIYLNSVKRHEDGIFPKGSRLPLRLFNADKVQNVEWFMHGDKIMPSDDGYYKCDKSGVLTAVVVYTDGAVDIISKEIIVK